MVQYRRNRVAGGTCFFTLTLRDRSSTMLVDRIVQLRVALHHVKRLRPFHIDAMVILPDHLHAIWTLPYGDHDYSGRWRAIKARFTRLLIGSGVMLGRSRKDGYDLWQPRFWEHTVRDAADLASHVDYIHYNPVKHGHVTQVADWPYSSFHRYVRAGIYPHDWAAAAMSAEQAKYGE